MQSPPFPRYLIPPRSKYSPQYHILIYPQLPFLPCCQRFKSILLHMLLSLSAYNYICQPFFRCAPFMKKLCKILTNEPTNHRTPWSVTFFEELNRCPLSQEIDVISWNLMVYYHVHKNPLTCPS